MKWSLLDEFMKVVFESGELIYGINFDLSCKKRDWFSQSLCVYTLFTNLALMLNIIVRSFNLECIL